MPTTRLALACTALILLTNSTTRGDAVLLIGGGDSSNTAMLQSVLQAQGETVTIGPAYTAFTGGNLSGYNDVLLVPGVNAWNMGDMPASGQQALVNYVAAGGGLVTSEALVQKIAGQQEFQTLNPAIPVMPSVIDTGNSPITFSSLTNNAVMNANLPSSFTFPSSSPTAGGETEGYYTPKAGATGFFSTNQWTSTFGGYGIGYGVIGWDYGAGRVVSFSTLLDNTSLTNSNVDTLLENALNWARNGSPYGLSVGPNPPIAPGSLDPVPEPAAMLVWGAGLVGFALAAYRRRRSNC